MDFPAIFKCCLLFVLTQLCLTLVKAVEVCYLEKFTAECAPGHVIMMTSAKYGLMSRVNKCIQSDASCSADVLSLSDRQCSGRNKCIIAIPNSDFESKAPPSCSWMKLYYEASYECVKVQYLTNRSCQRCDYLPVSDNGGILASSITHETRCGSDQCPWLIEVLAGQAVKLSLFDFGTYDHLQAGATSACTAYMVIKDGEGGIPFTVCRDMIREKKGFYTSTSTRVYVNIHVPNVNSATKPEMENFLLKYEVTGCPLPPKPEYGWVRYDGKYAYLGCNATGKESTLICKNTSWSGHHMNCSNPGPGDGDSGSSSSLTNLVVVVIIVGVAVCMCSCVVVIGLCCFKGMSNKRRHQRFPPPPPYDVSYEKHTGEAMESHMMLVHKDADPDLQKACDVHGTMRHVDHVKTKQGYRKEEGTKDQTLSTSRGHQTLKPAVKPHYEQIWEKQHANKTAHMKNTL